MWIWNISVALKLAMTWEDVCQYWDMECHKELFLNEQLNQFLFDLFCMILFHQGFANDDHPFYLGYVAAKYKTKVLAGYLFNICFQPSWKNWTIIVMLDKKGSLLSHCS